MPNFVFLSINDKSQLVKAMIYDTNAHRASESGVAHRYINAQVDMLKWVPTNLL